MRLAAARGGELASLLSLLAPDAIMRADLVGQRLGANAAYEGADAVAARFDGAQGASPVAIDGERGGAASSMARSKVAFIFQIETGLVEKSS